MVAPTQMSLCLFADEVDSDAAPRFFLSDKGELVGPEGYCALFSKVLRQEIASTPKETLRKFLPRWREYLNTELDADEDWRAIWREPEDASIRRQVQYLESRGHSVGKKRPIDGARSLAHPKPQYGNFDRLAIYRLYDLMELAGLSRENHSMLGFFAKAEIEPRMEYIKLMRDRDRRSDHIGRRFLAPKMQTKVSIPVDPLACVAVLEEDLDRANAPIVIKDANLVLRLNGKRPMSVIHANALGWTLKGMKDSVFCRNKRRGEELTTASFVMSPEVRARLVERLASEVSPLSPHRSVLDEVIRCREELGSPDVGTAREARVFLASVALFPRPSAATSIASFITYDGLRYWTIKGRRMRRAEGIWNPVHFNDGRHEPTLRDYRKATITAAVLDLFAKAGKNTEKRLEGLKSIAAQHDQSTDQSKAYASWAYMEENERETLAIYKAEAARRAKYEAPVRPQTQHLENDALKDEMAHLAARESRAGR